VKEFDPATSIAHLGERGNKTYVMRDENNREQIIGLLHVGEIIEVKHWIVRPDSDHKIVAYALLQQCMEINMRDIGISRYYFTIDKANRTGIASLRRDGAVQVDAQALRFMKIL
jgi:hypothetical protein